MTAFSEEFVGAKFEGVEFVEVAMSLVTEVSENQHQQQVETHQEQQEAQWVLEDMELNLPAHQVVMTIEDDRHVVSTVVHQTLSPCMSEDLSAEE